MPSSSEPRLALATICLRLSLGVPGMPQNPWVAHEVAAGGLDGAVELPSGRLTTLRTCLLEHLWRTVAELLDGCTPGAAAGVMRPWLAAFSLTPAWDLPSPLDQVACYAWDQLVQGRRWTRNRPYDPAGHLLFLLCSGRLAMHPELVASLFLLAAAARPLAAGAPEYLDADLAALWNVLAPLEPDLNSKREFPPKHPLPDTLAFAWCAPASSPPSVYAPVDGS